MVYTLYKITNNIDGKIYIGVHKTKDIDDGYMGSGILLKRAIKKHGIDNFSKEILQSFDTQEEMFDMESQLVNEDFVKRTDTYNIKEGGYGGWDHCKCSGKDNPMYGKPSPKGNTGHKHTDKTKKIISDTHKGKNNHWYGTEGSFRGMKHTDESKSMIGKANSKLQSGKGNSNYGNCWIYHPTLKKSKPIPRFDLNQWLSEGWIKGRKIKFD